jgi:hypothetical protein
VIDDQNTWGHLAAAAGAYLLGYPRQPDKAVKKMMQVDADVILFFDEARPIQEKILEKVEVEPGRHEDVLIRVCVHVIAHYVEGLGVLCVDLETHVSAAIKNSPTSRFTKSIKLDIPPMEGLYKESRALLTLHDHAEAVRNTVAFADDMHGKIKAWCDEHFDKIVIKSKMVEKNPPEDKSQPYNFDEERG